MLASWLSELMWGLLLLLLLLLLPRTSLLSAFCLLRQQAFRTLGSATGCYAAVDTSAAAHTSSPRRYNPDMPQGSL